MCLHMLLQEVAQEWPALERGDAVELLELKGVSRDEVLRSRMFQPL